MAVNEMWNTPKPGSCWWLNNILPTFSERDIYRHWKTKCNGTGWSLSVPNDAREQPKFCEWPGAKYELVHTFIHNTMCACMFAWIVIHEFTRQFVTATHVNAPPPVFSYICTYIYIYIYTYLHMIRDSALCTRSMYLDYMHTLIPCMLIYMLYTRSVIRQLPQARNKWAFPKYLPTSRYHTLYADLGWYFFRYFLPRFTFVRIFFFLANHIVVKNDFI